MKSGSTISKNFGLAHWMEEVPREAAKTADGFDREAVHDLRVALRRCRSMADGFRAIDPYKGWKRMRRQATGLFDSLGALRDCHVMQEWVHKLGPQGDPLARQLSNHLAQQETELKAQAKNAIEGFDSRQWRSWIRVLSPRTDRLPAGSEVYQALALERLNSARRLHWRALRTLEATTFHRLRIGVKKFRYVVENFLPHHHEQWKDGLKQAQEFLGEIHDLDVLQEAISQLHAGAPAESRQRWEQILAGERQKRVERYRELMAGENSLWKIWRAALPRGEATRQASFKKLEVWSAFLETDSRHNDRVARFAVQIFDGLSRLGLLRGSRKARDVLRAAAVVHEVGRVDGEKNHHKMTERMVGRIDRPVGWSQEEVETMAKVARYHRGTLPHARKLRDLPPERRSLIRFLAGILRLANALDAERDGCIRRIVISRNEGFVVIHAEGLQSDTSLAEQIAAARHLLESACGLPIFVQPPPRPRVQRKSVRRLLAR
ncbi:MAG TPA: CHAD domain-containing protein [Candidatus Angelobacter sp.]